MDKVIILIVIGGLMIFLAIMFFKLVAGIFGFSAMHIKATKTMFKSSVANNVYEYLKRNAVNGEIPESAIDQAIQALLSDGLSIDEINNFICDCCFLTQMEINKIRSQISKYEKNLRIINDLQREAEIDHDWITAMNLENKKDELEKEIEYEKQKLGE